MEKASPSPGGCNAFLRRYIGSSVNLAIRFTGYFNISYLSNKKCCGKSKINKALIKYGYSSFSLEILEYCDQSQTINREQYYLDLLNPEYNILKIAGSPVGYKHSEESLAKIRVRSNSQEHKEYLKKLHANPEYRAKRLEHLKIHNASKEQREKSRKRLLEYNKSKGFPVEVLDSLNNETTYYSSIREASQVIGCDHSTIWHSFKVSKEEGVSKLIKKRFIVKFV